jgi:DNA invertase Pin-like site-specific DNA recombinase
MIGYARVSTRQQETALQLAALEAAGVSRIYEEKRSGAAHRPVLEQVLREIQAGQVLVVYKVDRLARSLVDLMRILDRLARVGAGFKSLTEPLETQTPAGRMLVQMLGAIAEFERAVIRERCEAGRIEALARGVRFGARPGVDRCDVLEALRVHGSVRSAARALGCWPSTVRRAAAGVRRCDGGPGEWTLRTRNRQ